MALTAGTRLGQYEVLAPVGAGGMGEVYRARDSRLGRDVAVKVLPSAFSADPERLARFEREARAAAALNHPNICIIHDIDEIDGQRFIVMELIQGQNLRNRLALAPLAIHQVVDIGIQIADALDAAHSQGIIHRDIKSANIFLTDRGQVKVLDFGLAKASPRYAGSDTTGRSPDHLTAEGVILGTVSYMSPEQATGEELDGRTDLFSLGVVLYECATGRQPFTGKTDAAILAAILSRTPVALVALNPEIPVRLQNVFNTCLEKDRERRYQSAADLRADLQRVRREIDSGRSRAIEVVGSHDTARLPCAVPPEEPPASLTEYAVAPPTAEKRSRLLPLAMAATAGVVLVAVASYMFWAMSPLTKTRDSPPLTALATVASSEDDDAAVRRVVETYARAIETKDLALFQSVKPDLTPVEQRRLEAGFRAVSSQFVSFRILSIDRRGQDASVRLIRRDSIQVQGRQQVAENEQTLTLARTSGGFWLIVAIRR